MFQPITDTTNFGKYHDLVEVFDKRHQQRGKNFYKLCLVSLFVQCIFQIMFVGIWFLIFWPVTIFAHLGIAVLATHVEPAKPKWIYLFFISMLAGTLLFIFNAAAAIAGVVMYLPALKNSGKAVWLSQQPGYPYFNERFMLQQDHYLEDYDSEYHFSDRLGDEMFAVEETDAEMEAHSGKAASEALLMENAEIEKESK